MIITNNTNTQNFNLKMRPQQTCRIPFRGNALPKGAVVDIKANGKYPANILSNFAKTGFEIDGVKVASIEGFLQALKTSDVELQKKICQMNGYDAKKASKGFKRQPSEVLCFWNGKTFSKSSPKFKQLLNEVLEAKAKTFNGQKFKFAGLDISSVKSFILGLKTNDKELQKQLLLVPEDEVREVSKTITPHYGPRTLYWNGKAFSRSSEEYNQLLDKVYNARYKQDFKFRTALRTTKNAVLEHSIGKNDIGETVLTKNEFLKKLNNLQNSDKFGYKCFDYLKSIAMKIIKHK